MGWGMTRELDWLLKAQSQLNLQSKEKLDNFAKDAAKAIIAEIPPMPGNLLTPQMQEVRVENEMKRAIIDIGLRLERGLAVILSGLDAMQKQDSNLDIEGVAQDLAHFARFTLEGGHDKEFASLVENGGTIQELIGISDTTYELFYRAAKHHYELEHFQDAADAFFALSTLNGQQYAVWFALANCEYFTEHYEMASQCYGMAIAINPQDPAAYLFAATCNELLYNTPQALALLDAAIPLLENSHEHADWLSLAKEQKSRLASK